MTHTTAEELRRFAAEAGFNVVSVDGDAVPGERVRLIDHCATRELAEQRARQLRAADSGGHYEVVEPRSP